MHPFLVHALASFADSVVDVAAAAAAAAAACAVNPVSVSGILVCPIPAFRIQHPTRSGLWLVGAGERGPPVGGDVVL